jgi:hypothetical protein
LAAVQASDEELRNALPTAEMARLAALLRKVLLVFEPDG